MNHQDGPLGYAGPYRLVSHLASGGMGVVYLAEREDGGEPVRAAVKLLRRGIDEDQARRFASERQILATLAHPNIARLIDAGVTDDDRPYLVMEYVAGVPIDRYCDAAPAGHPPPRVAAPQRRAGAVAHAHQQPDRPPRPQAVEHPRDRTTAAVKLLDFGIAKLRRAGPRSHDAR